jgi:hypothetical protein
MSAIAICRSSATIARVFLLAALGAIASDAFAGDKAKEAGSSKAATPPPLIEVTAGILGVKLFAPLEEARENFSRYKLVNDAAPEAAEKRERERGERIVWRFAETEYQWIVAWSDKEGKVVKISASLRPEKTKPFKEIGDLSRAKAHNDSMAMWSVQRPDGASFRLVAKGPGEHALSIYLYSLQVEEVD